MVIMWLKFVRIVFLKIVVGVIYFLLGLLKVRNVNVDYNKVFLVVVIVFI